MDDSESQTANAISEHYKRFESLWSQSNSPQIKSRKRRIQELEVGIQAAIRCSRPNTLGDIPTSSLKNLVVEQNDLQKQADSDRTYYDLHINEAIAQMKAAIHDFESGRRLPHDQPPTQPPILHHCSAQLQMKVTRALILSKVQH
jgi:hypothetical protein